MRMTVVVLSLVLPAVAFAAEADRVSELAKKLGAEVTADGVRAVLPSDSFFEAGKAELRQTAKESMEHVLAIVRLLPECRVRIESHTDSRGTGAFNAKLSQDRAEKLKRVFEGQGLNNVYEARSYGEKRPVASNATAPGRAANRRIEIVIETSAKPGKTEGTR